MSSIVTENQAIALEEVICSNEVFSRCAKSVYNAAAGLKAQDAEVLADQLVAIAVAAVEQKTPLIEASHSVIYEAKKTAWLGESLQKLAEMASDQAAIEAMQVFCLLQRRRTLEQR